MFALTLVGKGAGSILADLDGAKVAYSRKLPRPGVVMNSGETVEIIKAVGGGMPWMSLAYVLVKWLQLHQSRKIIVTKNDNTIIHLEGFTAKELEAVLPDCKSVMIMEANPHNENEHTTQEAKTTPPGAVGHR